MIRQTTSTLSVEQLVMSTTIIVALVLLQFRVEYGHCATTVPQMNITEDMLSLLQFRKEVTSDPYGFFTSWNSSVDYCNWEGITCSRRHPRRVIELSIDNQSLGGQIPPSLGNLTFLREINLPSNAFFGQLPDLNRLSRLEYLNVSNNQLQGQFAPDAFRNCSSLFFLDFSMNNLVGSVPHEIGFLPNLNYLTLKNNNFTRIIPSSLHNISQLQALILSGNQFEGSIPEEVGLLSNLGYLALQGNRLSGSIPPTILNHSLLQILDVRSNFLHMVLPSLIGNALPNIFGLALDNNMFYGKIPASLGNASGLQTIYFRSNSFTGQVPTSLGQLPSLRHLRLDQNKLEANDGKGWDFVEALGNCSGLQELSLSDNQLQGPMPN